MVVSFHIIFQYHQDIFHFGQLWATTLSLIQKNAINQKKTIRLCFFLPENPATAGTFFLGTVFHYFHLETAGCEQEAKFGRMAQYCEPWLRERSDISQHLHKIGCKQVKVNFLRRRNTNLKNPRLKDLLSALSTLYSRQGRQAAS